MVGNYAVIRNYFLLRLYKGFPNGSVVKDMPTVQEPQGDMGSIPVSGRSPGEGHGNPLQYSCLENTIDRGAWWATVHGAGHNMHARLHKACFFTWNHSSWETFHVSFPQLPQPPFTFQSPVTEAADPCKIKCLMILKWSWCNNNKVHNKCNVLESSQNHALDSPSPTLPPHPWKNCIPRNQSLVPKMLGTTVLQYSFYQNHSAGITLLKVHAWGPSTYQNYFQALSSFMETFSSLGSPLGSADFSTTPPRVLLIPFVGLLCLAPRDSKCSPEFLWRQTVLPTLFPDGLRHRMASTTMNTCLPCCCLSVLSDSLRAHAL